jgi:hypothetical protein
VSEACESVKSSDLTQIMVAEELSRAWTPVTLSYGAHSNPCIDQLQRIGTGVGRTYAGVSKKPWFSPKKEEQ